MTPAILLEKIENATMVLQGCERLKGTKDDTWRLGNLVREAKLTKQRYEYELIGIMKYKKRPAL